MRLTGVWLAVLVAAPSALGLPTEHSRVIGAIRHGHIDHAVTYLSEPVMRRYVESPGKAREVLDATLDYIETMDGINLEFAEPLIKRLAELGRIAGGEDAVEPRVLQAECEVLAARFRLRLGDGSGLTAWRKAARDLAAWKDGKNARARARAVELAATAAMAEGAPADEIIEEARRFGGAQGDLSLPALAYRVALARRQFAQNKPAAAKRTLATTMEELRKRLDARSPKDRYLSRTYNDAVQWAAQERKLGLKFEFLLEEHVDLGVRYSVPAGGRWTIHKKTASRPAIEQRDPDGQLVREIAVHGIPEGTHKAVGLAHEPDPKKRVARWENRARREMPKLKKLKKPKAVTINRTLGRAYVLEAIGGGPVKSRRRFLAYEWTGKHNKHHYTLLIDEYNNADPKDPALAAFLESLREN